LDDLRRQGVVAVVFSRPSTHETLQLKAIDARVTTLKPDDPARIATYMDAFGAELRGLGYSEAFAGAMTGQRRAAVRRG
jgi:hypothetical protein